jgi:hypothetical protein
MGYLNAQPGDDQLIEGMGETGTDQVPGPSYFENTGQALAQRHLRRSHSAGR